MKGLNNLIRMHKWKLDEKRRELVDMEALRDEFSQQVDQLGLAHAREQQIAAEIPEVNFSYANFAIASRQQQENLAQSIAEIAGKIDMLSEEVADCFQELKKYEIVQDMREKKQKIAADRTAQIEQDDLAIDMYRRKRIEQG